MAAYLGPESPRPFAVISEGFQHRLNIPYVPEYERYSFGDAYENKMCELVHRYLELGTDDRFCYVGDSKGTLAYMIQRKFCLLEPVTTVIPGHIHYEETPGNRLLPIRIANVGAEEYFRRESRDRPLLKPSLFDKVLFKDAVQYFENSKETYKNIIKTVSELGKILLIHRPGPMNTLPLSSDSKQRIAENEPTYMDIIRDLQSCGLDVKWEIECLPVVISKMKWLGMVKEKFPPQVEAIGSLEVTAGLRDLTEGVLKYEGDMVEFSDRLLFITASRTIIDNSYPSIQRHGSNGLQPIPGSEDLKYKMAVKGDLERYIKAKLKKANEAKQKKLHRLH